MTPNEQQEKAVQDKLIEHVDSFVSFQFNAGAGAGKTYALIETLKYVAKTKILAKNSPQKVLCITYTNVAVTEIRNRLGNSEAVKVSTIHERVWELIKRAQPELLICHADKIKRVIEENWTKLTDSTEAQFFNKLNEPEQQGFIEFVEQTKDTYYQSKDLKAAPFRQAILNADEFPPDFLSKCLKSVNNYIYVVNKLYTIRRLEDCLGRINDGKEKRVYYDSKVNTDRLHYMRFSHDTLLEYSLQLVENYPTLCRIIADSYPYFFIDEYQDTHQNVIKLVTAIHKYSQENNKKWMVGYFGDTAQNIYDDGVGRSLTLEHKGLTSINKVFNRRSHQQIINIANSIRADDIKQKAIFEHRNQGSVKFFYGSSDDKNTVARQFLADYQDWLDHHTTRSNPPNGAENRIHCLVLTNKLMAELMTLVTYMGSLAAQRFILKILILRFFHSNTRSCIRPC